MILTGGFFFKYMMEQQRQARRQSQSSMTSSIAYSIAMLGRQKIQKDVFPDTKHPLSEYLFQPFETMGDLSKASFSLGGGKYDLSPIATELLNSLSEVGSFSYELYFSCKKADFSKIGVSEYSCEKTGLVCVSVVVTFKRSDSTVVVEDFNLAERVLVTSAFVPLVSKFTLFVQDSEVLSNPRRFNLLWTDQFGRLLNTSPAKPWVLTNSSVDLPTMPKDLDSFVREPRGLVFLGGGKVLLNISRGWVTPGEYSEGFHLFGQGNKDGFYSIDWVGSSRQTAILSWDQGICYEIDAPGARDWWEFIREHPQAKSNISYARANSIFKLLGAGYQKSPTFVLGEVFRTVLSARAFKSVLVPPSYPPDFLLWKTTIPAWRDYVMPPLPNENKDEISDFCMDVGLGIGADGLKKYQEKYASKIANQPYNISLAFFQYPSEASPIYHFEEEFQKRMVATFPKEVFFDIPKPFQINEITNLKSASLNEIINKNLLVPGPRTAKTIYPFMEAKKGESPSILKSLQKHDLITLDEKTGEIRWNLNGWIYVDVPDSPKDPKLNLDLNQLSRIESNGGLVLKRGNISIRSSIISENGKILQLVTLKDGDISIESTGEINASLIAVGGSIKTRRFKSKIFGSLAMNKFDSGNADQGAELKYNSNLGLPPSTNNSDPNGAEKRLLSASFEGKWMVLK
ncbi:hypothetical protein HYY75_13300 [bacterium]|nr:hypothetical protein [bacterium]